MIISTITIPKVNDFQLKFGQRANLSAVQKLSFLGDLSSAIELRSAYLGLFSAAGSLAALLSNPTRSISTSWLGFSAYLLYLSSPSACNVYASGIMVVKND